MASDCNRNDTCETNASEVTAIRWIGEYTAKHCFRRNTKILCFNVRSTILSVMLFVLYGTAHYNIDNSKSNRPTDNFNVATHIAYGVVWEFSITFNAKCIFLVKFFSFPVRKLIIFVFLEFSIFFFLIFFFRFAQWMGSTEHMAFFFSSISSI